jgi:hypothetical protein
VLPLSGIYTLSLFWIERPELRLQYVISYLLCWTLLGTLLAIVGASVGPCFYRDFYGDGHFDPLMNYLRHMNESVPLPALKVQGKLLEWATHHRHEIGSGISAFPSMHLSTSTLYALFAWRVSRGWGLAATAFLGLIFLGSIHLGYHYAVDGYASLLLTPPIWWASGLWARAILAPTPRLIEAPSPAI